MDSLISNFGVIVDGFVETLKLLAVSAAIALVLGTLVAAARVSPVPILRGTAAFYVTLFRNTPLLVLIIVTYYGLPEIGINPGFFPLITMAMGLYTASFVAEALRSGINAVPAGQIEASRAVGMPFGQTMTAVVLPQAFRATVPPLASVLIALTKNTSLAATFGIAEATFRAKGLINDDASARWPLLIGVAVGYIIIVETISLVAALLERHWRVAR